MTGRPMSPTTRTATFVGGPLDGEQVSMTLGARRFPIYRDDGGHPIPAQRGDRQFCQPGSPLTHHYALQVAPASEPVYVHASVWCTWSAERRPEPGGPGTTGSDVSCKCDCPRKIRVSRAVFDQAPVWCVACWSAFLPPDES